MLKARLASTSPSTSFVIPTHEGAYIRISSSDGIIPGSLLSLHRQTTLPLKLPTWDLFFLPDPSFHSTSTVQTFSHVRLQSLTSPIPCGSVCGMRGSTADPATEKSAMGESNLSL